MDAFKALLELDEDLQETIVGVIEGECGVAPCGQTLCGYCYRGYSTEKRNLFILSDCVALEGGRQKGQWAKDGECKFVVRAATPAGGKTLARYLSLVRQVLLLVMKGQNWCTDAQDAYHTHLLATYKVAMKGPILGVWPSHKITRAWHATSLPYIGAEISLVHVHQVTTGIF